MQDFVLFCLSLTRHLTFLKRHQQCGENTAQTTACRPCFAVIKKAKVESFGFYDLQEKDLWHSDVPLENIQIL